MNPVAMLKSLGFSKTVILDGKITAACDHPLIMALWYYEAEDNPNRGGAWIHPYYLASHQAYQAAKRFVAQCEEAGIHASIRDDVLLKPILAKLPGFSQGRNTLSYVEGAGSRFYVKLFEIDFPLENKVQPEEDVHPLHCGACRRCMDACPTKAITEQGFIKERCVRFWMMPGKPVPEAIRSAMGNRLIGCDECQRCCPHNPAISAKAGECIPLADMLQHPKETAEMLRERIGANLALPNRVLAQVCMLAGCSGDEGLLPLLEKLASHPSQAVAEHASWAARHLKNIPK